MERTNKEIQSEIQDIMGEIRQLQQSLNAAAQSDVVSAESIDALADTAGTGTSGMSVAQSIAPILNEMKDAISAVDAEPVSTSATALPEGMEEFHGSIEDAGLEETLVGMRQDSAPLSAGTSLFDAIASDSSTTVADLPVASFPAELTDAEAALMQKAEEPVSEVAVQQQEQVKEQEKIQNFTQSTSTKVVNMPRRIENPSSSSSSDVGTLSMTLTGAMVLKLNYECGGQEVCVSFNESSLQVQLADGTEFKIPLARKGINSAAA